jgi:hypothetical protein
MTGELPSDPYLRRIQSIINAPVREQLEAISNWHDNENPSRMALGAVASCALNYVQSLEAAIREIANGFAPDGTYTGRPIYEIAPQCFPNSGEVK